MAVTSQTPINVTEANGLTTVFPYNFLVLDATDLLVRVAGVTKTLNVDYTVSGVGNQSGGNVTFTVAPAFGLTVVRQRVMPYDREQDYQTNGNFAAAEVNADFDRPVMMIQQLAEAIARAIVLPPELAGTPTALPGPESLKGLRWNALANGLENYTISGFTHPDGAANVGYQPAGAGAFASTVQAKLRERVSVEDFGAIGNGVADDTAAFRSAAAAGRVAELRDGVTYVLTGGITMTSGSGFVCPDGMATIVLRTGSGAFNITAQAGDRMNIDRCVFSCSGTEGVTLSGIAMQPDGVNARVIYPVRVSTGCATAPARISRMRFSGFHIGAMVSVNSVGAAGYIIDDIFAVNCGTSLGIAQWGAGVGQWTLFETDNDLVGGVHSQPGVVTRVGCRNCLHTGTGLTDFGQQTDCINIAGISGGVDRKGPLIVGVYADGVGEGIDIFGSGTVVRGMRLRNCHVYGVKLTHGASGCSIDADFIENSGAAAVTLFGSSTTAAATTNNSIRVGVIRNVGQGASFSSGSAVLFGGGTLSQATQNVVTVDAVLEQNSRMTTVVQDGTASSNNGNLVKIGKASGWTAYCSAPPANVRVRSEDSSRVRLTMSANQTLNTTVAATVAFNTVQVDALGEAITGSNVIRCKTPGAKLVTAKIRVSGQNALDDMFLAVQLNGVNIARVDREATSGAIEQVYDVTKIVYIGEDIAGTSAADLRIVATHTGAATATVLNTATMSDFEVVDLA